MSYNMVNYSISPTSNNSFILSNYISYNKIHFAFFDVSVCHIRL